MKLPPLTAETQIEYGHAGGRPLLLDILRPTERSDEPRPAVIYVHGGGWLGGDRSFTPNQILAEAGFFSCSISYRFSNEATFPAQIHDVKAAIRWVRANARTLGIDAARIGIWGHSAGGHLAALAAVAANHPELEGDSGTPDVDSSIRAAVPISAPLEFLIDWYAVEQLPVHEEGKYAFDGLFGGNPFGKPDLARGASPFWHAGPGAPPQLMVHGELDDLVPIGQARAYTARLRQYGSHAELIAIPETGHQADSALYPGFDDPYQLKRRVIAFFAQHLR